LVVGLDLDTDTLKMSLHTNSYTPAPLTHDYADDLTNEVSSSGTGYTTGGATLGSKTLTLTAANSWGTSWATGTAYAVGDVVKPTSGNTHVYVCIVAGTSHGSTEPTWPTTSRQTVADNTVTWAELGSFVVAFDCADPSWASSTITARYGVVYKSTGTAGTSALIGYLDFGGDIASTNGTFAVTINSNGLFAVSGA
jgi:hypothetical protein